MLLKVYYLDDDTELLEMFSDLFSSADVSISVFEDPQKAIDAIKNDPPDVFFVDYRLPNITGDKVVSQIDPSIPRVLITGELNLDCESHFNLVLKKPYKSVQVRDFLDEVAKKK